MYLKNSWSHKPNSNIFNLKHTQVLRFTHQIFLSTYFANDHK